MHQNPIPAGALPRPCWESLQPYSAPPDILAGFKGPTSMGRGVERNRWDGMGVEGKGGEGW